ncbi:ubiquinone/menaquinone biosynthesis C-methylase UbiE [Nonlabens dokdonensis]|uniref:Methyltransferase n=2 Tax=Nonlabens dokdonensis TaxID=328515 RepID=L7W9M2_NONDD|nr:class I SAM-dependent methyltransferase [Nonlabens dokdonensis]AGC76799.1 methyltransferase [Nonlabens dokdonensis DSW-6]PZX44443.1 ubiquinone/menaquinone biosynthesis C-methylase UbiE [Nonlabens dokdonensis]
MNLGTVKNRKALRDFWYGLSPDRRYFLRKVFFWPLDTLEKILGRRHKYVPSRGAVFTGGTAGASKFIEEAHHQLQLLQSYTNLQPENHVLDIGCGVGRTAIALTDYLNKNGSYNGFDPVENGIVWCKKGIGADYPNFKFTHVDLYNDLYKNQGEDAAVFKFPYQDSKFNLCFSFSVFTHMSIKEIQNYLFEMYRVSSKGAVNFSTFFTYNSQNEEYISTREGFQFPIKRDGFRLMHEDVTAGNIAIEEDFLLNMISIAGFKNVQIIHGFWKDQKYTGDKLEYQDTVIFEK